MRHRRGSIKTAAGLAAGTLLAGRGHLEGAPQAGAPTTRREVRVGGKRVKVVDVHAHAAIAEVADVVKATPLERYARGGGRALGPDRIQELDKRGIDVQALDINSFWWYAADRDLGDEIVQVQDEGLAKWVAAHPDRFVAFTSVGAAAFPDLAAEQTGGCGQGTGDARRLPSAATSTASRCRCPSTIPFWAKAAGARRPGVHASRQRRQRGQDGCVRGCGRSRQHHRKSAGDGLFLSHLIFDGTLDRFPGLKVCGAHAGGYLPSYFGRTDVACDVRQNAKCQNKKHPREYLRDQIMADSMVFSAEGIRHLVAEMGAAQVVYGTDIPLVWPDTIDAILEAQIPDAQKEAILGETWSSC